VYRCLPGQTIHRRCAVISNLVGISRGNRQTCHPTYLQLTLAIEEYILRLHVAVSNTLGVEVRNALQNLPEAALNFARGHAPSLDRCVEIATRTELHDLAPVLIFVLDKIDGLDDVDVMQG
jgi:hypothetical protein